MKFSALYSIMVFLFSLGLQAATTEPVYVCELDSPSQEIGAISISQSTATDQYFIAIEWLRPIGREDIQEVEADPVSDFTVEGFYSEELKAGLFFYSENDYGGKRDVFEINGNEMPVKCTWVGK